MLSLFTKNAGAPKLLRFGTPTFIVEPKKSVGVNSPNAFLFRLHYLILSTDLRNFPKNLGIFTTKIFI